MEQEQIERPDEDAGPEDYHGESVGLPDDSEPLDFSDEEGNEILEQRRVGATD